MGCDIHIAVEKKVANGNGRDKWVMVSRLHWRAHENALERNYERFAMLAGVRGDGPDARGIPDDVSESGKLFFSDFEHTPSWGTFKEVIPIFKLTCHDKKLMALDDKAAAYDFFGIDIYQDDDGLDNYRIIYYFDS